MQVALLTETFARNMGYLENLLPKYLARLGVDVHVVTMDLPPYYHSPDSAGTYAELVDTADLRVGLVERWQGFTLHVLPHRQIFGYMQMGGLLGKLRAIKPDIVQTTAAIGWLPLQGALCKPLLGYKLFTGNHYHASVFPLAQIHSRRWSGERLRCAITRTVPGWLVSLATESCYAITHDCAELATRFFGVPQHKIKIFPLGVDTEIFTPVCDENQRHERLRLRQRLGFSERDIVCIYTGRFSEDKNPLLLARAVAEVKGMGHLYRGLFLGNGVQRETIEACPGCVVHPFVPVRELGGFFRASDIGVWPTQESTSMLDAAACGLPIIANHTMDAPERLQGNGLTYRLNDLRDLCRALLELRDSETRKTLGACGARKMANEFSLAVLAARRLRDYEAALMGAPVHAKAVAAE